MRNVDKRGVKYLEFLERVGAISPETAIPTKRLMAEFKTRRDSVVKRCQAFRYKGLVGQCYKSRNFSGREAHWYLLPKVERKRVRKPRYAYWTKAEDDYVTREWGYHSLKLIAKRLGRTPTSVQVRAKRIGLNNSRHGLCGLGKIARVTGYSSYQLITAIERLGIIHKRIPVTDIRQIKYQTKSKTGRVYRFRVGFEESDVRKMIDYLTSIPDGKILYRKNSNKQEDGQWGVGRYPTQCLICQRSDRPRYAKSLCRPCYTREYRKNRKPGFTSKE